MRPRRDGRGYIDSKTKGDGIFLSVLFLDCLNFLRGDLAGPMGVQGISLVYCCCNSEEMAPELGSQLKITWPGPGVLTLQA